MATGPVGLPNAFPLTRGHTRVVPCRHDADYFALWPDEQTAMWRLVNDVQRRLVRRERPDGYDLGVSVGAAGGQTVGHAHPSDSALCWRRREK